MKYYVVYKQFTTKMCCRDDLEYKLNCSTYGKNNVDLWQECNHKISKMTHDKIIMDNNKVFQYNIVEI